MEYYEDFCDVWLETHQIHEHKSPTSVMFSLVFHLSFIHIPEDKDLVFEVIDEDRLLDLDSLIETTIDIQTFKVERNRLIDTNTSRQTLEAILSSMNVPCRPFFVEKILNCAREMARDQVYENYKVLRLHVGMSAIVDDDEEALSTLAETTTMLGVSKSAMKKLEMVEIENQNSPCLCSICLEEFFWGLRVIKMPCSHVFHRQCIVNWLKKSKLCPLCRFEMK